LREYLLRPAIKGDGIIFGIFQKPRSKFNYKEKEMALESRI
jgi:hypothetical protein